MKFRMFDTAFECFIPVELLPNPIEDGQCQKYSMSTCKQDKNGKEIYQGDILLVPEGYSGDYTEYTQLSEVQFDSGSNEISFYFGCPDDTTWEDTSIVGNIYEHPDMIDFAYALLTLNNKKNKPKVKDIESCIEAYFKVKGQKEHYE